MELKRLFQEDQTIERDAIVLRPVREEDGEALLPMYSDESIYRFRPGFPRTTLPLVQKVIRRFRLSMEKQELAAFAIVNPSDDGRVVGLVEVFHVDPRVEQAEIGYTVTPAFQGRGIATAAVGCITDYLILQLGFNRVYASVHKDNANSMRVLSKNDFLSEGTIRQGEFWQGIGFVDVCRFSKLLLDYGPVGK